MKKLNCILLVDDNRADNLFHSIIIKKTGVCDNIKTVADGEQALEYLEKSMAGEEANPLPDIIFLDINMPRINGFEFLEKYSALDVAKKSSAVIVMLTTSLNPHDEEKARTYSEVHDFFIKPLSSEKLMKVLEKY